MSQLIAIVGRPNVGKSTLFNRLIGERKAITDNISGVTRDRIHGNCYWNGKTFAVVDTGGFVHGSEDVFEAAIRSQALIAMDEADIILFVVDVTTGVTDLDEEIANILRKSTKNIFLVVNKVDNYQRELQANEFWSLGFENTFFIASISGSGTGDLLDAVVEVMPEKVELEQQSLPRLAIVGQPNVGKSSFINALLAEDRNIVTDIAGTTRDSTYSAYNKFGHQFLLIDTAGIRKKSRVHEDLEFYSVIRAVKAIEEADVCFLMLDSTLGVESQDLNILSLIHKRKKGVVLLINKWDLVDKDTNTARDFSAKLKRKIAPFNDIPILFISVLEKQRIFQAIELGIQVYEARSQKIATSKLNKYILEIIENNPPPSHRGLFIKIKYVTQLPMHYPAFAFYCNHPKHVKASYKNFLENKLREKYNFSGVPISLFFRDK